MAKRGISPKRRSAFSEGRGILQEAIKTQKLKGTEPLVGSPLLHALFGRSGTVGQVAKPSQTVQRSTKRGLA